MPSAAYRHPADIEGWSGYGGSSIDWIGFPYSPTTSPPDTWPCTTAVPALDPQP